MKRISGLVMAIVGLLLSLSAPVASAAQAPTTQQRSYIVFNTLNAIYHLSRDAHGVSILTTEETIDANFPNSGFSGITRAIPKKFNGRSVDVKILSVTDAAGNTLPYKTSPDNSGNLVVTTGDPDITLSGSQIIKMTYQTRDVVNLSAKNDEFLLDVNGRGWNQGIGEVDATVFVAPNFRANLTKPSCYTSRGNANNTSCKAKTEKRADATAITANAKPVRAYEALIVKMDFKPDTFVTSRSFMQAHWPLVLAGAGAGFLLAAGLFYAAFHEEKDETTH